MPERLNLGALGRTAQARPQSSKCDPFVAAGLSAKLYQLRGLVFKERGLFPGCFIVASGVVGGAMVSRCQPATLEIFDWCFRLSQMLVALRLR